jgi:dihydrofolate reductase
MAPAKHAPLRRPATLALIAAVARNGAIGKNNDLVFGDPLDQRHFRATTMGCPVIMGRKTWESLPERFRPLPGRRNVVVSRNAEQAVPGAELASSLPRALALVADAPLVFVMGGGELYAQALPLADRLELTEVDADLPGDVFFPAWDPLDFHVTRREEHESANGLRFSFVSYERRRSP